jgi:hypothetical protein
MTAEEFIKKWNVKKATLASKLGMSTMTYINRYKDPKPEDEARRKAILAEMKEDLESVMARRYWQPGANLIEQLTVTKEEAEAAIKKVMQKRQENGQQ